jgi:hypothetical protein
MNYYNVTTKVNYEQISLTNVTETKFLDLIIDDTLTWKQHLILYDIVNRNKVSIYINSLYFLFFTHYMFRPLRAILK